jgi:hypothetical protein
VTSARPPTSRLSAAIAPTAPPPMTRTLFFAVSVIVRVVIVESFVDSHQQARESEVVVEVPHRSSGVEGHAGT